VADLRLGPAAGEPAVDLPFASIIVPVKDGPELLVRCVHALLAQDYPRDCFEIIVVDNGSAVSPAPVLPTDPRLILLAEPAPGSYAARNTALARARGSILAFTDADCLPDPGWLRVAVEFLQAEPGVAMIGGRVQLAYQHGEPRNGAEWFEFVEGFPQEKYIASGFAVTANMVTRRSEFDRVGPFDSSLLSGGDAEWGRRVRAAGGEQRYLAGALVLHPARDTWSELSTKAKRTTSGIVRRTAKGPHPRRRLARLLAGQLYRSLTLPITVFRRPELTAGGRRKFLLTRWRVDYVIIGTLIRGLAKPAAA